jgi:hypothetical protein
MIQDRTPSPPVRSHVSPDRTDLHPSGVHQFFSTFPTGAESFHIKTCRAGPQQGQAKLSSVAKSLVERDLMRLDATLRPPRLFFTEPSLAALCAMMADRRLANPADFGHVRQELGIDPRQQDGVAAD